MTNSSYPSPSPHHPTPPSHKDLHSFLTRQIDLLALERHAEIMQTSLLSSSCSPKLLERKGLSIGGLTVMNVSVGLGGRTMVELGKSAAWTTSGEEGTGGLGSHTFRSGDPAKLEANPSGKENKKGKMKSKDDGKDDDEGVEGVVSRVNNDRITLSLDASSSSDLPSTPNLRIIKLANSATFDRMDSTIRHLARIILNPSNRFGGMVGTGGISDGGEYTIEGNTRAVEGGDGLLAVLMGLRRPIWGKLPLLPVEVSSTISIGRDSASISVEKEMEEKRGIRYFDESLNESQKEAVEFALRAEEVACIHGPPGTGKTYTLVEVIRQLVFVQKKRVLVCGASNLAVDNLLTRLSPLFPPHSLLRLGHPSRISPLLHTRTLDYQTSSSPEAGIVQDVKGELEADMKELGKKKGEKGWLRGRDRAGKWDEVRELRKEYRVREAKVVKNVVGAAQVVLSTCHGAGSRQIANMTFDVCIIDEATQAVEAVCWIPILKSRKLILAGDPLQLPPTILSTNEKEGKNKIKGKPLIDGRGQEPAAAASSADKPIASLESAKDSEAEDEAEREESNRPRLKPPRTLETTLFDRVERLYGEGIKRVLKVQYRMHESIASFPSDTLYSSSLISHETVAKRTLLDLPGVTDPTSEDSVDTLTPNIVFFDTAGLEMFERLEGDGEGAPQSGSIGDSSRYNENEAQIVVDWVKKLVELGVPPAEIAIVTPYQAQVAHIRPSLEEYSDLIVGSVDGMQGQEREVIVLSLVRSNSTREVGFLAEHRRLNVAMTRAKRQLCIVGDSSTVGNGSKYLKSWMSWLEDNADVRFPGQ